VTGAPIPFHIDGTDQPTWAPVFAAAGTVVELGAMRSGCRSYLAVRGGLGVAPVLGSHSTDVNGRIGPFAGQPLRARDALELDATMHPASAIRSRRMNWRLDPRPWLPEDPIASLRLLPGSHLDRLQEASRNLLFFGTFTVQADSNRTGLRLSGPKLEFREPVEMVSEGCVPGLLQLPPSGQPIAFGPECPVSGGYPRIGQVAAVDIPRLAQRRPGDALRFVPCTFDDALCALRERERALARLEAGIASRLQART
jgi:antagonist of KipI